MPDLVDVDEVPLSPVPFVTCYGVRYRTSDYVDADVSRMVGVSTESVGTPSNSLPTHWYGGPGVGAIATYDRIEIAAEDKERLKIDSWGFRVAWSKPQSGQWPGEAHHSPGFRFTFLESFEIGTCGIPFSCTRDFAATKSKRERSSDSCPSKDSSGHKLAG